MNASGMSFQELAVKMEHDMAVMDTIESLPPLQELVGQSADFDTRKANHLAPVGRTEATNNVRKVEPGVMQFAADGKLLIGESLAQVQPYGVTDHGWTQFCGKLGEALTGKGTSLIGTRSRPARRIRTPLFAPRSPRPLTPLWRRPAGRCG
jgi:hypothetical protein